MKITRMRVNHLKEALGFRLSSTIFSWVVEESAGMRATASRIVVTSEGATVADTDWAELDSLAAKVEVPLRPRTCYEWTVAVRTDAGEEVISPVASFETGKRDEPWQAQWIVCDGEESPRHPIFSRAIELSGEVVSARLYACGLGFYDASIKGEREGEEIHAPGPHALHQ